MAECKTEGCTRDAVATMRITMGQHQAWQEEVCFPCKRYYLTYTGQMKWQAVEVVPALFEVT